MTRFIALSGFLGAGKTTTMTAAADALRAAGHRVAVVTNDQGTDLVDTAMAARKSGAAGEITGGCFCCRFEDLVTVTNQLIEAEGADVVIAESVGSCTDLTATVLRPLAELYGDTFTVAPLTTVVDPLRYLRLSADLDRGEGCSDLAYLYGRQLADAAVIGVNKADLLSADELADVVDSLSRRCPHARVVTYSAADGDLEPLLAAWTGRHHDLGDLNVDYQRYGQAEARLAWLNESFQLRAEGAPFDPAAWAADVLDAIAECCRGAGCTVGHVKLMVGEPGSPAMTKASLIDAGHGASLDVAGTRPAEHGRAVLNARVDCEPAQLEGFVATAVDRANRTHGVRSVADGRRSFKPGQPRPTHRILVTAD